MHVKFKKTAWGWTMRLHPTGCARPSSWPIHGEIGSIFTCGCLSGIWNWIAFTIRACALCTTICAAPAIWRLASLSRIITASGCKTKKIRPRFLWILYPNLSRPVCKMDNRCFLWWSIVCDWITGLPFCHCCPIFLILINTTTTLFCRLRRRIPAMPFSAAFFPLISRECIPMSGKSRVTTT